MYIAVKSMFEIRKLKARLSSEFEMKELGASKKILDMVISQEIISLKKISTTNNPADMMIKSIITLKFKHCLDLVFVLRC